MYEGVLYSKSIVEITNTQNRYSNSEKEEYFMGVWEEIWDKTKDVANAAGKKTGEIVEISKYKIQVAQINGDIRSQYEKLGNAVYNMVKADYENPELDVYKRQVFYLCSFPGLVAPEGYKKYQGRLCCIIL